MSLDSSVKQETKLESVNSNYDDGYIVAVSSNFRVSGTDSDFNYMINIPKPSNGRDFNRVMVTDAAIPHSFWLVTPGHNQFQLVELGIFMTITVPPGNYSILQWCAQIPLLMNAASAAVGHNWTYTAARQSAPDTGLIVYTVAGNGAAQPSIIVNAIGDMQDQVGFEAGTNNSFVNNRLTSTTVYSATGEWGLRILSDLCESDGDQSLCDIYDVAINQPGTVLSFQAQQDVINSRRFVRTGSNLFHFQLIGTNSMRPISTNGLEVTFRLKIFRREEDTINVLKQMVLNNARDMQRLIEKIAELQSKGEHTIENSEPTDDVEQIEEPTIAVPEVQEENQDENPEPEELHSEQIDKERAEES